MATEVAPAKPSESPGEKAGGEDKTEKKGRPKKAKIKRIARNVLHDERLESFDDEGGKYESVRLETLKAPHVHARIRLDKEISEYSYNILEPALIPQEEAYLKFILETLNRTLVWGEKELFSREEREEYLVENVTEIIDSYNMELSRMTHDRLLYYIVRDFMGFGKVDAAFLDPNIEDISCDGVNIPIFLYHRDFGSIKSNIVFETDEELDGYVIALAQRCQKLITVAEPILDATLPDGSRMNCTLGRDVTTRGSTFTIRKFKADPLTPVDILGYNTCSEEMIAHIWLAVEHGESIICAGGSASGKTATMNILAMFIPAACKIISIEDTREINIPHENWIAGVTRGGAEAENPGDIDMYDLLRSALRQRPEYVLVGEVRGKETMTMFQAMATGHTTYSTMHAESVQSIVYRLENPPINIPRVLLNALNMVIIHRIMRVGDKRVRRMTEIVEIIGIEPTTLEVITNRVFHWTSAGDTFHYSGHSNMYEKVMEKEDMTNDEVHTEVGKRADCVRYLVKKKMRGYREVTDLVFKYYEDSEKTMEYVKEGLSGLLYGFRRD